MYIVIFKLRVYRQNITREERNTQVESKEKEGRKEKKERRIKESKTTLKCMFQRNM